MAEVYVVIAESGEYSDHVSVNESVHRTYEGAVHAIESQVLERCMELGADDDTSNPLLDPDWAEDGEPDDPPYVTVFCHPRRHGSRVPGLYDVWYVDNDHSYDSTLWRIEAHELVD